MNSDEMRVDLESFVNKGITEGWQGWPLKGPLPCQHEGIRSIYYGAATGATGSSRGVRGLAFREEGRFGQMFGSRFRDFLAE